MKKPFFLVILVFILQFTQVFGQETVTIKGEVLDNHHKKISLLNILQEDKEVATAFIDDDGKFELTATIETADYFKLSLDAQVYLLLVLVPGENLTVTFNKEELNSSKIKGSPGSEMYYETVNGDEAYAEKLDEMTKKIEKERQDYSVKMIEANPNSIASIIFAVDLDYEEYFETHKLLVEGVRKYEDNEYVSGYIAKFDAYKTTGIGAVAQDIDQPTPDGKNVKLSSLRGQYVLIDFWAAWCRPCRGESPTLIKAYNKYHKKGFTIYSVSLDDNKEDWVAAIEKDELSDWTHVSDLKGWKCEPAKAYGVSSIPANFLLDKEGKIVAKDLRGEDLLKKLEEIFK